MTNYTHEELRRGKRLCREVLPRLKAQARKDLSDPNRAYFKPETGTAQGMLEEIRMDNIDALVVYCRNGNEWHADVVLKNMGIGRPNVLGTQSSLPKESEQEAKRAGLMILKGVVSAAVENEMASRDVKKKPVRHFILFNLELEIDFEVVKGLNDALLGFRETMPELAPTTNDVVDQLETRLVEYFGETGFSRSAWDALDEDSRMRMMANILQLVVAGVPRYPMPGREPVCELRIEEDTGSPEGAGL
jgi:hypothetical protein